MGRAFRLVLVVVIVAGAAAGGWWWWQHGRAADADALPALTKADATRAYLDGPGKSVTQMFNVTPDVVDVKAGSCASRVKEHLFPLASPDELSVAAGKVPDPTARDLALAQVSLLTEYAASCKGAAQKTEQTGERLMSNKDSFDELMGDSQ